MKQTIDPKEWADDFKEFLNAGDAAPPKGVTEKILAQVDKDLNPPAWSVFGKLALVQAVVGTLTLLFCPQFGISILPGMGLMHLFMQFGATVCMAACGVIFLGAGALVSSLVLKPEEVKIIRRNRTLQLAILSTLSIGTFICLGASVVATLGGAWIVGSTIGGVLTLELGWYIRSQFRRKLIYGL